MDPERIALLHWFFFGFFHGVDTIFILCMGAVHLVAVIAACLSRLDWIQTKTNEFSGRKQICRASTTQSTIPTVPIIFYHVPYFKKIGKNCFFFPNSL
jgi:hypothetical protein